MNKKYKYILTVSLVLNIVLFGIIAGHAINRITGVRGSNPYVKLERVKISPEAKERIKKALDSIHEKNSDLYAKKEELRAKTIETLTAPEFNAAEYRKEMIQLYELHGDMMKRMTGTIIDTAATLSPEERKALAKILRKPKRKYDYWLEPKAGKKKEIRATSEQK